MVWKLKNKDVQSNFEQRVGELTDIKATSLWKSFHENILKSRGKVCGQKVNAEK